MPHLSIRYNPQHNWALPHRLSQAWDVWRVSPADTYICSTGFDSLQVHDAANCGQCSMQPLIQHFWDIATAPQSPCRNRPSLPRHRWPLLDSQHLQKWRDNRNAHVGQGIWATGRKKHANKHLGIVWDYFCLVFLILRCFFSLQTWESWDMINAHETKKQLIVIIYISVAEGEFDAAELYSRIVSKMQGYVRQAKQRALNWHMGLREQRNRAFLPEQPVGEGIFIRCLELVANGGLANLL